MTQNAENKQLPSIIARTFMFIFRVMAHAQLGRARMRDDPVRWRISTKLISAIYIRLRSTLFPMKFYDLSSYILHWFFFSLQINKPGGVSVS